MTAASSDEAVDTDVATSLDAAADRLGVSGAARRVTARGNEIVDARPWDIAQAAGTKQARSCAVHTFQTRLRRLRPTGTRTAGLVRTLGRSPAEQRICTVLEITIDKPRSKDKTEE